MPEPTLETNGDVFGHENVEGHTVAAMRAYGQQCYEAGVRAERERDAKIVELFVVPQDAAPYADAIHIIAAAIRKG